MTKQWKLTSFILASNMPCSESLLLMGSKYCKCPIRSLPPHRLISPPTSKKEIHLVISPPFPKYILKACIEMNSTFTKFEASKSDQIRKLF